MVEISNSHSIVDILEQDQQAHSTGERMLRSKYGMLEILRSAFSKSDAILLLR